MNGASGVLPVLTAATAETDNDGVDGAATATLLERMAQYRVWAEQRLTELTSRLQPALCTRGCSGTILVGSF